VLERPSEEEIGAVVELSTTEADQVYTPDYEGVAVILAMLFTFACSSLGIFGGRRTRFTR